MTTRSKAQQIINHLIGVVFASGDDTPVAKALDSNGYVAPEDFLMETDETLEQLTYTDEKRECSRDFKTRFRVAQDLQAICYAPQHSRPTL